MFRSLEGCGGTTLFESLGVGGGGGRSLSCSFTFGTPNLGSEFILSPWGATPSVEEWGPDPAPPPGDSEPREEPGGDPSAPDPGVWIWAEVELAGDSVPPDARPEVEDPELGGDRLEEESVSVAGTGTFLE